MATLFSKIIAGEISSWKIAENKNYFAFLDINPLAIGHALVIPKRESSYILDMEDKELQGLIVFAKKVGKAIESVVPCKRMGLTVIGLEVPHTHIHLIPINTIYDMDFKQPKLQLSDEEFKNLAQSISESYEKQ